MEEPQLENYSASDGQQTQNQYPQLTFEQLSPLFAQWSLQAKVEMSRMEHYLRGETEVTNPDNSIRWDKTYTAIMNEQGIYELMRYLSGVVSKLIVLSNVDKEQARKDTLINANAVAKFLFINHSRFELKLEKYEFLCTEVTNLIEFTINRATNKTTLGWIHPESKENIHTVNTNTGNASQKKSSPFTFLGG